MKKYLVLWENIAIGEVILDETTQIYKANRKNILELERKGVKVLKTLQYDCNEKIPFLYSIVRNGKRFKNNLYYGYHNNKYSLKECNEI